jgi:hypothetical protein
VRKKTNPIRYQFHHLINLDLGVLIWREGASTCGRVLYCFVCCKTNRNEHQTNRLRESWLAEKWCLLAHTTRFCICLFVFKTNTQHDSLHYQS